MVIDNRLASIVGVPTAFPANLRSPSLTLPQTRPTASRLHYAWIIVAVTFVAVVVTAGVRATPSVLIVPLEDEMW